jgi:hypothetical protein
VSSSSKFHLKDQGLERRATQIYRNNPPWTLPDVQQRGKGKNNNVIKHTTGIHATSFQAGRNNPIQTAAAAGKASVSIR